jgi:biotin operon repressor
MANTQLSVTELAYELGITRQAVLKKIKSKKLPKGYQATRVGNQYVITFNHKIK